ncbi:hypothetical protein [Phosphitispora fastidiosa]|uniref:hypothetical protein n=1 Tax=Phosphitispora fastidiosa TaxID=2837202 RepID=UPI001E35DCD7|nr:hypothetical protein [Phosphitispora fastidiosa]MBU7006105.1 hypothetical protein [Phosphitispora fastidiosa]
MTQVPDVFAIFKWAGHAGARKFALVVITTAIIWLNAGLAAAAPAEETKKEITIDAKSAFGYHSKQGAWLPLQIEAVNSGPDIEGQIKVVFSNQERFPVDYRTKAVIPSGSTKKFDLNIPVNEYTGSLKVQLVTGKTVLAEDKINLTFHPAEQPVIGLLDREPSEFRSLYGISPINGNSPVVLNLKQEFFPEQAEVLSFFDILVIDDVNLSLDSKQQEALNRWVNQGGILAAGGGAGWQKVIPNLPPELAIARVSGVETNNLASLHRTMGSAGVTALGGPVQTAVFTDISGRGLYGDSGRYLAIEKIIGSGKVIYLAYDPALEPMAGWKGTGVLWQELLFGGQNPNTTDKSIAYVKYGGNSWALMEALNTIPQLQLPSLNGMAAVLALYALLVGPLSYLVLKKLDKREWTWVLAPSLAIVFVAVIYVASFQERRSEVLTHQIGIVDAGAGTAIARAETTTGIFAPKFDTYRVELEGQHFINALPANEYRAYGPGQVPESQLIVEQSPTSTVIELKDMDAWVMRGFSHETDISLAGTISGELQFDSKGWVGVVTNNTEYDFTDGVLVTAYGFKKTGPLKAGKTLKVEMPKGSLATQGPPFYYQIYNPGMQWQGPGSPPRQTQQEMLRQQLLEALFNGAEWNPGGGQTMFLAWSDQKIKGTVEIPGQDIKHYYTTLFKLPMQLKTDADNLNVPPGFIMGTVIDSSNIGFGPPGIIHMQPGGKAVYQFELPEGSFDTMEVYLSGGGGPVSMAGFLYNWSEQQWDTFNVRQGGNAVKDYQKYVNNDHMVKFRIESDRDGYEVTGVSISLSSKGGGTK